MAHFLIIAYIFIGMGIWMFYLYKNHKRIIRGLERGYVTYFGLALDLFLAIIFWPLTVIIHE